MSDWHECSIGPLWLGYRITAVAPTGVQRQERGSAWPWPDPIKGNDEWLITPNQIRIKAEIRLASAGGGGAIGALQVGFVQSVVASERKAQYGRQQVEYVFLRQHEKYPVKDGAGDPWYKQDADETTSQPWRKENQNKKVTLLDYDGVNLAGLTKYTRGPSQFIQAPSIEVWDEPKFGFPAQVGDVPFIGARVDDNFITCLAVKVKGRFHGIHEITWRLLALMAGGPMPQPAGGIAVLTNAPLQPPYELPPTVALEGPTANEETKVLRILATQPGGKNRVMKWK